MQNLRPNAIRGLLFVLSVCSVQSIAADEAALQAGTFGQLTVKLAGAPQLQPQAKLVTVALAEPVIDDATTFSSAKAPSRAEPTWPAPARFFTINQVLAKQVQPGSNSSAVQLAAVDPPGAVSDAPASIVPSAHGHEPFGLFTFRAPQGLVWEKWRKVEADIAAEAPALARCRAEPDDCSRAAARFVSIVKDAANQQGHARFELVNRRVNAAIRYTADVAQWHQLDVWSAPLDARHKGSFETGLGDCEDYAIAKYVALREAGVPTEDLRLLLVRDNAVRLDHAVLAAREDAHWLVLDNRWSKVVEDTELRLLEPLFALNDEGVKLFAAPYAAKRNAPADLASIDDQPFGAGNIPIRNPRP